MARTRLIRPSRAIVVLGVGLIAALVVGTLTLILNQRESDLRDARREATNLSVVLAEETSRSFQSVDLVLKSVAESVKSAGITSAESYIALMRTEAMHQTLRDRISGVPQLDAVTMITGDGTLANFSRYWPIPKVNVADRDYFKALRDTPGLETYIGEPVQNRGTGTWTIYLARRLNGPQGEFLGLILGAIELGYFEKLYQIISLGEDGSIALVRRDGKVLGRYPATATSTGSSIAGSSPLTATLESGRATLEVDSAIDGTRRIISGKTLPDYPLVVFVTRGKDSVLAEWRARSIQLATGALIASLALALVTLLLVRQLNRLERSQQALSESETRLRHFTEISADWLWETDTDHRLVFMSERAKELGFNPDTALGKTFIDLVPDADDSNLAVLLEHMVNQAPIRELGLEVQTRSGTLHLAISGTPVLQGGRFSGYRGTARDVTDAVASRAALYASEERYRSVVDDLAEVVFRTDAHGCWTFLNPAWEAITGYSIGDTLGKLSLDFVHPDDRRLNHDRFMKLASLEASPARYQIRLVVKGGEMRWFEVFARATVSADGKVTGTAGTLNDVTEQRGVAEALRASEASLSQKSEILERTLEHMSQGIMMVDAENTVQVCNPRALELLGLPPELLSGHPKFSDILRWQWAAGEFGAQEGEADDWLRRFVLAGGIDEKPQSYERTRPNGTVLEIRSLPLAGGGVVRTYTDITDQRASEQALRSARDEADRAAQAKSDFLAMMSHEIRSPMSGLLGIIELLSATELGAEQRHMVELVNDSATSLLGVLNDVLDFSKIEAGAIELCPEITDLHALLNSVIEPLSIAAAKKSVPIERSIAHDLPERIVVDQLRLRQVLLNLLNNAVKFTPVGSISVAVAVERIAGGAPGLRFVIRDTGIGMDVSAMARLFEPFAQADASTTRYFGGTGLGLSISRRLARLMGGDIQAESEVGHGSTFTLRLPLLTADLPADASRAAPPQAQAGFAGSRVLIVEDQPINRWLLQRQLERLGVTAEAVDNGYSAIDTMARQPFDMVITDCHMPGMDGPALSARIRAIETESGARRLPILGLTADVTTSTRERCAAAGMDDIEAKPIKLARLEAVLRHLLLREASEQNAETGLGGTDTPLYDAEIFNELFDAQDPEGGRWLARYLSAAAAMIEALQTPAVRQSPDELTAAAHKLAGMSLSAGATRLGHVAREIENAAKRGNETAVETLTNGLPQLARETQRAIETFIAAGTEAAA